MADVEYLYFTNEDGNQERRNIADSTARQNIASHTMELQGHGSRLDKVEGTGLLYARQWYNNTYEGVNIEESCADEIANGYSNVYEFLADCADMRYYSLLAKRDYINIPIGSNVYPYRIGAFDYDKGTGASEVADGSILMVPKLAFPDTVQWKADNNNGTSAQNMPYLASKLHDYELNTLLPQFPSACRAVMKERVALLEKRYSASSTLTDSNGWDWANMGRLWSFSEVEFYGQMFWSGPYANGADTQIELFRDPKDRIFRTPDGGRADVWSRCACAGSSTNAGYVNYNGNANNNSVSATWVRCAPGFLIGPQKRAA